jgi:hypothetical protein
MKRLRALLRIIFYLFGAAVSLAIAALPIAGSWWVASGRATVTEGSMRWCIEAKTSVVKGIKLTDENVDWTIRRVKAWEHCVSGAKQAVGKYAVVNLMEGDLLKPEHFSEFAPAKVPDGGAAVTVEVKTEHAAGLKPGMRLAFVQEKEKTTIMIPEAKKLTGLQNASGFELLSITASQKDASVTAVTIAAEKSDLTYVPTLASGQWRPVILRPQ